MARAFGDFCLKDFGLIFVPEISYRRITDRDEFIILATDGVWDVLSNKEVVDIVASAPTRSYAARALVESAVRSWRIKYPTSKVNDCVVVCLFLNSEEAPNSSSSSSKNIEVVDAPSDSIEADSYGREEPSLPTSLDRSGTVRSGPQVIQEQFLQPADGSVMEVEGVSRVDTMLTLPRFVADDKIKKSA